MCKMRRNRPRIDKNSHNFVLYKNHDIIHVKGCKKWVCSTLVESEITKIVTENNSFVGSGSPYQFVDVFQDYLLLFL